MSLTATEPDSSTEHDAALREIEQRVLWLATAIVDHANRVRPNPGGLKVGGHQASSASMVTIMTALWLEQLRRRRPGARSSRTPRRCCTRWSTCSASSTPRYLTTLREFGGLQSYPSRLKDPVPADYSTGSRRHRRDRPDLGRDRPPVRQHRSSAPAAPAGSGRWSATPSSTRARSGRPCSTRWSPSSARSSGSSTSTGSRSTASSRPWAPTRLQGMFAAAGWQVLTVKYGRLLEELFARPGGARAARPDRRDVQPRVPAAAAPHAGRAARARCPATAPGAADIAALIADVPDDDLRRRRPQPRRPRPRRAARARSRRSTTPGPTVVIAYTLKGYGLATEGHPQNHSALLTEAQLQRARRPTSAPTRPTRGPASPPDSAPAPAAAPTPPSGSGAPDAAGRAAARRARPTSAAPRTGTATTQAALGRTLLDLNRAAPEVGRRVVTVSPDVSSVDQPRRLGEQGRRLVARGPARLVRRRRRDDPALARAAHRPAHRAGHRRDQPGRRDRRARRHLEPVGPAAAADRRPLRPVRRARAGAVVVRHLRRRPVDPGRDAVRGDAGAPRAAPTSRSRRRRSASSSPAASATSRRSRSTPSGACSPRWPGSAGPDGSSAYLRLSTRPVDQSLAAVPADPAARERRRRQVVAGAYPLRRTPTPGVTLVAMGAVVPEVLAAAERLDGLGLPADVVVVTSPGLLFRAAAGPPRAGRRTDLDPRQRLPGRAGDADGHRARRAPAHAGVPRRRHRVPRRPPRRDGRSGRAATWRASTGCTASTPTPSSAPPSTSWTDPVSRSDMHTACPAARLLLCRCP